MLGIAGPYTNFSTQGEYSYSTSFPQPIMMVAAFDDALITKVGTVISTEARAFNNANRLVNSRQINRTDIDPQIGQAWISGHQILTHSEIQDGAEAKKPLAKIRTTSHHTFRP